MEITLKGSAHAASIFVKAPLCFQTGVDGLKTFSAGVYMYANWVHSILMWVVASVRPTIRKPLSWVVISVDPITSSLDG